ncbi:MAG: ABC transporter substrate-binding protein [Lachnospiraceae bacterium]|nr:ABC transporter substrate-binding protein [Lachnospiraceae bacterium]
MKFRTIASRLAALMLCGTIAVSAAACGKKDSAQEETAAETEQAQEAEEPEEEPEPPAIVHEEGKQYIGVILEYDCESYRNAIKGFQERIEEKFGDSVVLDIRTAGDRAGCTKLAERYVAEGDDMIFTCGTVALEEAMKATDTVPIMATCVADIIATGGASTKDEPGGNVTGVCDLPPVKGHIKLIVDALGDVQTVGMVYGTEVDSVYQTQLFRYYAEESGLTCTSYPATDSESLRQALTKACAENDVIYLPTDTLLLSNTEMIREVTVEQKKPVLASDRGTCRECALLGCGVNYSETGKLAADKAYEVLSRNDGSHSGDYGNISKIKVETLKSTARNFCNPSIAQELGWENTLDLTELEIPTKEPAVEATTEATTGN